MIILTGASGGLGSKLIKSLLLIDDIILIYNNNKIEYKSGKIIVKINPRFYRPAEVEELCGDSLKANNILGWKPTTNFKSLVQMMVDADLDVMERDAKIVRNDPVLM